MTGNRDRLHATLSIFLDNIIIVLELYSNNQGFSLAPAGLSRVAAGR
jgi:hypothetical protein